MKQCLIVGVDVSKDTLDIFCKPSGQHVQIQNKLNGFKDLLRFLKPQISADTEVLIVMEHTGFYSYRFERFLQSKAMSYCKLPALEIKRSIGMVRGKNDKIDAERIATYGWLRREILQADQYPAEALVRLRAMLSTRLKLVRDKSGWQSRLKELLAGEVFEQRDSVITMHRQVIQQLSKQIEKIEQLIREVINADEALKQTYRLLVSIKGVGLVIATAMIAYTENFKRFSNARKFNCYAGLAPFKHESGRSIKKKTKVSHLANKSIKALLSMGASTAIQHDAELKTYYQRRLAEGKEEGQCLNIIKAKLVARIFAVVKRQTPYQPILIAA